MEWMVRFSICLFLLSAAFADTPVAAPPKAPPEVEAALRDRVSQFFQYQIQGKFYKAEQFVAEESKDFFVGSNKNTYTSYEIQGIQYSEDFTKATVLVRVNRMVALEGFLGHPVPWSVPSRWKIENGLWCWYVNPDDLRTTPFGIMPRGSTLYTGAPPALTAPPGMPASLPGAAPAALPPGLPPGLQRGLPPGGAIPGAVQPGALPGAAVGVVAADRNLVQLKTDAPSSGRVHILNLMPVPVNLSLQYATVPGLTVKLDRTDLKAGEKAAVIFQTAGAIKPPAQTLTVGVRVEQTRQTIPIKVSFTGPSQ